MTERIDAIMARTQGETVLDLGAVQHDSENVHNSDWLHKHLVRKHDTVIGVDILTEEITELQAKGYDIREADVERMMLPVEADTVVAGELLEHVSNPGLMLERVREHLKLDGRFILTTPNPWAIVHLRRHIDGSFDINDEHTGWYGPQTLNQLLQRHDFQVLETVGVGPEHKGLTGIAQSLKSDVFGATTWLVMATRKW